MIFILCSFSPTCLQQNKGIGLSLVIYRVSSVVDIGWLSFGDKDKG